GADTAETTFDDDGMAELLEYPEEVALPELNEDDEMLEYPEELPDEELWDESIMLEDEEENEEVFEPAESDIIQSSDHLPEQSPEAEPAPPAEQRSEPAIRQKSELEAAPVSEQKGLSEQSMLNLFQYLKNLTEELPEPQKKAFKASEARLKMEYVIDKLEGHKGLFKSLTEKVNSSPEPQPPFQKKSKPDPLAVAKTLAYLSNMAKTLPDKDLTHVIEKKVDTVVKGLVSDGGHRE
ncbi:MAG TPA: hypothetical protein PK897_06860, partial [Treponema sp.]|nr:hypothetical protein [Treponema sp.]